MKRPLIVIGLILLMSPAVLFAETPQTYLLSHYANNAGPGSAVDQVVRLVNVGSGGTPMTSPAGDICTNIYVFDNNQEMVACCSCRLTPNELASASVAQQLTNNPLTSVVPAAGVVKILPITAGSASCSPIAPFASSDASLVTGYATHVQVSGPATYITETSIPVAVLGSDEAAFLNNACLFIQYLGSRKGTCGCTSPGH
jgi:hypothetical protein